MKTLVVKSIILLFILATWATEPVFSQNQEQLFQQALMKEEGEGALQEAIDIYSKIVENASAERLLRANAQLQIGLCYEKLGEQQATEAYNKVIEQFADQQQAAKMAKTRLLSLTTANSINNRGNQKIPSLKQIPFEKNPGLGYPWKRSIDFTQDGKQFVVNKYYKSENDSLGTWRNFIADASGLPIQLLVKNSELSWEGSPTYSPDGKHIAFLGDHGEETRDAEGFVPAAIYMVNATGGEPKKITDIKVRFHNGLIWHPDGQKISTMYDGKKIDTYKISGELINSISIDSKNYPRRYGLTAYSPDGKWISYFKRIGWGDDGSGKCGFISTDGKKHSVFGSIKVPAQYGTWSPNGFFYYVAGLPGDQNIYRVKVDLETGEQTGEPEQITNYVDVNISQPNYINEKSGLAYVVEKSVNRIVIPENETFESFKTIATGTNPVLSPDGETVYFAGVGKDNQGIYSVERTGGNKKRLTNLIPDLNNPSLTHYLSPDGSTIAFFTKISNQKKQLCFLSTNDNKLLKTTTIDITNDYNSNEYPVLPAWSPDNKKVAFLDNNKLFIIPAWGKVPKLLTDTVVGDWETHSLRWSPDGNYIAGFVFMDGKEVDNSIVIVSTKTGKLKRLTEKEEWNYKQSIEWYPDSKKLAYMYYDPKYNNDGLREAYVDGSPSTEFINQPDVWDYVGTWDPMGTNYYFIGDADESTLSQDVGWLLYKYNTESKTSKLLTNIGVHALPSFSRNGEYLVLCRPSQETQLWLMEGLE